MAAKKLPSNLRVAGYDIRVITESSALFTDDYHGQYLSMQDTIRLSSRNSELRQRETLLHELIHAIDEAYEIDLEERQVGTLSRGLYAAIKDNPKLLDYLKE